MLDAPTAERELSASAKAVGPARVAVKPEPAGEQARGTTSKRARVRQQPVEIHVVESDAEAEW